jgi:GAF domain-containing protein
LTREERIVGMFVEFADLMLNECDLVEFLYRLLEQSMGLLGCVEAGLLLADATSTLQVVAFSSERSRVLERLQAQRQEGPCFESYRSSEAVYSENLAMDHERWPAFATAALATGIRSVLSVPMRVRGETIGALNLFRGEVGRVSVRDLPLAQGFADIAAVAILQDRAVSERQGVMEQLQRALDSRVLIEQAKGILAERSHVSVDAAFVSLRAFSRAHNLRLSVVAQDVIENRIQVEELIALLPSTPQGDSAHSA